MKNLHRLALLAAVVLAVGVACKPGASPTMSDDQLWGVESQFNTDATRATRTYRRAGDVDDRQTTTSATNAWNTLVKRRLQAGETACNPSCL